MTWHAVHGADCARWAHPQRQHVRGLKVHDLAPGLLGGRGRARLALVARVVQRGHAGALGRARLAMGTQVQCALTQIRLLWLVPGLCSAPGVLACPAALAAGNGAEAMGCTLFIRGATLHTACY